MTTSAPETRIRWRHVNLWLVAGAVLTAAVVGLAGWIVWPGSEARSADEVLVDDMIAAINSKDVGAVHRIYTRDAVVTFGPEGPDIIVRKAPQQALAAAGRFTRVGEPTTMRDPPSGLSRPKASVDQHYVVAPVLIHDDPFVVVLDVRNGTISTQMIFEPFEPFRF